MGGLHLTADDKYRMPEELSEQVRVWANQPDLEPLLIQAVTLTDETGRTGNLTLFVRDEDGQLVQEDDFLKTVIEPHRWIQPFPTAALPWCQPVTST